MKKPAAEYWKQFSATMMKKTICNRMQKLINKKTAHLRQQMNGKRLSVILKPALQAVLLYHTRA